MNVRAVDAAPPWARAILAEDNVEGDYSLNGTCDVRLLFAPEQNQIPIPFEVLEDALVEGPEGFQLQFAPNVGDPVFAAPDEETLFASAFVRITDNDGIIILYVAFSLLVYDYYVSTDIVVGYDRNYTVSEDIGRVEVCVIVINPLFDQPLLTEFFILASTSPATAGMHTCCNLS